MEEITENIEEIQDARAFLRERYLRAMSTLAGRACKVWMFENTTVQGKFAGCDLQGDQLLVSDLKTHLGTVPQSLLRGNDIIRFAFKDITIE